MTESKLNSGLPEVYGSNEILALVARAILRFKVVDLDSSPEQIISRFRSYNRISEQLQTALLNSFNQLGSFDSPEVKRLCKDPKIKDSVDHLWAEIQHQKELFPQILNHPFFQNLKLLEQQSKYLRSNDLTPLQFYNVVQLCSQYCPDLLVVNPNAKISAEIIQKDANNNNNPEDVLPAFPSLKTLTMYSLLKNHSAKSEIVDQGQEGKQSEYPLLENFLSNIKAVQKPFIKSDVTKDIQAYLKDIPEKYHEELYNVLGWLQLAELQEEFCQAFALLKSDPVFSMNYQTVRRKYRLADGLVKYAGLWRTMLCDSFATITSEALPHVLWLLATVGNEVLLEDYFSTAAELIPDHADVNKNGFDTMVSNQSLLTIAIQFGNLEAMKYLLEKGARLDLVSSGVSEFYPLHYAVAKGKLEETKLLLSYEGKNGSSKGLFTHDGLSVITCAAKNNHMLLLQLLIQEKAKFLNKNSYTPTALHWAIKNKNWNMFLAVLAHAKSQDSLQEIINLKVSKDKTPLFIAYKMDLKEFGKRLVREGAEIPNSTGKISAWVMRLLEEMDAEKKQEKEKNIIAKSVAKISPEKKVRIRMKIQNILGYTAVACLYMSLFAPVVFGITAFYGFGLSEEAIINFAKVFFVSFFLPALAAGTVWAFCNGCSLTLKSELDFSPEKDLEKSEHQDEIELSHADDSSKQMLITLGVSNVNNKKEDHTTGQEIITRVEDELRSVSGLPKKFQSSAQNDNNIAVTQFFDNSRNSNSESLSSSLSTEVSELDAIQIVMKE